MPIIIFFLLSLFSCKDQNPLSLEAKPFIRTHPFVEDSNSTQSKERRKLLLHLAYLDLTKNIESRDIYSQRLNEIPSYVNHDYQNHYQKFIVSYPEKEEIYYIDPKDSKEWILKNLNITMRINQRAHWIENKNKYLVFTTDESILKNEVSFQTKELNFRDVNRIELKQISKYQKMEMEFTSFKSEPILENLQQAKKMGNSCDHGMEGRGGTLCYCQYQTKKFNGVFNTRVPYNLTMGQHSISINGNELKFVNATFIQSFEQEEEFNSVEINFESLRESLLDVKGIPLNDECPNDPIDRINYPIKFSYDVKVKIKGAKEVQLAE